METIDYAQFLPAILYVLGAPLQFLRAQRTISKIWTYAIAIGLSIAGYMLCHKFGTDSRLEAIQALLWIPGGMGTVLGGTFTASNLSKAGVVFPITDSKGTPAPVPSTKFESLTHS